MRYYGRTIKNNSRTTYARTRPVAGGAPRAAIVNESEERRVRVRLVFLRSYRTFLVSGESPSRGRMPTRFTIFFFFFTSY